MSESSDRRRSPVPSHENHGGIQHTTGELPCSISAALLWGSGHDSIGPLKVFNYHMF